MAKKSLETLTEAMYYVLLALRGRELCGTEIADYIARLTGGRVRLGPGTLYTVLGIFEKEEVIRLVREEGRKRTYRVTEKGSCMLVAETERLRRCLADGERSQGHGAGTHP